MVNIFGLRGYHTLPYTKVISDLPGSSLDKGLFDERHLKYLVPHHYVRIRSSKEIVIN